MNRELTLSTVLGDSLQFKSLQGTEELSHLYRFAVVAVTQQIIDFRQLIGTSASVAIQTLGKPRYLHGQITQVQFLGRDQSEGYYAYELVLTPDLWYLSKSTDNRVFQNQTAVDILKTVFSQFNLHVDYHLLDDYPQRTYCVQYDESDFAFASRLMEHEGIYYYFKHEKDKNTLVLVDDKGSHPEIAPNPIVHYVAPHLLSRAPDEYIQHWEYGAHLTATGYATLDYDFEKPRAQISAQVEVQKQGVQDLEIFEPFGGYDNADQAKHYAMRHLQAMQWSQTHGKAISNVRSLTTGHTFTLTHAWAAEENQKYLIYKTDYDFLVQPYTSSRQSSEAQFQITAYVIPASTQYRAPRVTPAAKTYGPLTATVVGPAGEEIWTDKYGRIKIQFHWDREGQKNEHSSCWVRVSSPWAGGGFGGVQIPRVKEEVVVDFVNGNVDRPIVVGRVYNANNMPPVKLPEDATQSGFFTRTKGGDPSNFNRLMFEDAPGKEMLSMVANRDMKTHVKNDQKMDVVGNVTAKVGGDRSHTAHSTSAIEMQSGTERTYDAEHERIIDTQLKEKIGGNNTETYEDGVDETITGTLTSTVSSQATHELLAYHKNTKTRDEEQVSGDVKEQIKGGEHLNVRSNSELKAGNVKTETPTLAVNAKNSSIESESGGSTKIKSGDSFNVESQSNIEIESPSNTTISCIKTEESTDYWLVNKTSIDLYGMDGAIAVRSDSLTGFDLSLTGVSATVQGVSATADGINLTVTSKEYSEGGPKTELSGLFISFGKQTLMTGAAGGGGAAKSSPRKGKGKKGKKKPTKKQKRKIQKNSRKKNRPRKKRSRNKKCKACSKKAIMYGTGEEIFIHEDFMLEGGIPIEGSRLYRSSVDEFDEGGSLGPRWISPYHVYVDENAAGDLCYLDDMGLDCYTDALEVGDEVYDNEDEIYWSRLSETEITITDKSFITQHFISYAEEGARIYRLERIEDRQGNKIELRYDRYGHLSTVSNDLFDVHYETAQETGRIHRIYHYVTDPETGEKIERPLANYTYDAAGDLVQASDAYQRLNHYAYDHHLVTRYTDKTGRGIHLVWDGIGADARAIAERADDGTYGVSIEYDEAENSTTVTSALGTSEKYIHNADHYLVAWYRPDGTSMDFELDEFNNLLKITHSSGVGYEYEYDDYDNLIQETAPDGSVTRFEYDEYNQVTKIIQPGGEVWMNEYDEYGNQIKQIDPLGHITQYTYTPKGQISTIVDAKGGTKRILYNEYGLTSKYIDCSGKTTQWEYDEYQRIKTITNALGQSTTYSYDHYGQVQKQAVDGLEPVYFKHDAEGRLLTYIDGLDNETHFRYNPAGLISERIDALGHSVHYQWDLKGQLKRLWNEKNEQYLMIYDPVGRVAETTGFDGKNTRYHYDKATGQLKRIVEADDTQHSNTIDFVFDTMNRLLERKSGDLWELFYYDVNGNLNSAQSNHSRYEFTHDPLGNVLSTTQHYDVFNQATQYTWRYAYDELSNLIKTTRPDGREMDYLRYGSGHLHGLLLDKETLADFERDNLHREIKRRLNEKIHQKTQFDLGGRLAGTSVGIGRYGEKKLFERHYHYDKANHLTDIKDSLHGDRQFKYDPIDRLIQSSGGPLGKEVFAFDPADNLIKQQVAQSSNPKNTLPENIPPILGNLLKDVAGIHFSYDTRGNMLTKTQLNSELRYEWNGFNQLTQSMKINRASNEIITTQYQYDVFGLRIAKDSQAQHYAAKKQVRFAWDGFTLGLEEHVHEGKLEKAIHYLYEEEGSFEPIAQYSYDYTQLRYHHESSEVKASALHYYLNDQIGTPKALLSQEGEMVWQQQLDTWGRVVQPGMAVGGVGSSTSVALVEREGPADFYSTNIRFQGQYHDEDSGLHYNTFRYYDPEIGRYISQDPIGLNSGEPNFYQYAIDSNTWIDPLGLAGIFTAISWSATKPSGTGKTYKVFQQAISFDKTDSKGRTNLQRMKQGLAPLGSDGESINLHHSKQQARGPLFELTSSIHRKYGHTNALHPHRVTPNPDGSKYNPMDKVDRNSFNVDRSEYWEERARAEEERRKNVGGCSNG